MKKSMGAKLLYFVLVAVVLILLYNMMAGEAQQSKERSLGELYQMIENGEIYSVGIYNSEAVIVAVKMTQILPKRIKTSLINTIIMRRSTVRIPGVKS